MIDDFREDAEKHWLFIEKLLEPQIPIEKVKYLYIEALIHGFKHGYDKKSREDY